MAAPIIPPIPINALVAYDEMPPGGLFLASIPHPVLPDQRKFAAVDQSAFPNLKVAPALSKAAATSGI